MNILETKNLFYKYRGGIQALINVSISVHEGQIVALLGSNGAGKSTLMRHLNGILMPESGDVRIEGEVLTKKNVKDIRKKVGVVFQNPDDQIFSPTVREDIAFGPVNLGLEMDEIESRVSEAMDLLEITHLASRPPHQLSGGEKKRVAIAGVIAMKPRLLVLDEPSAGLDPAGIRDLLKTLRHLVKNKGITLLFSTHHVDIVPELADYVYVMHHGEVAGQGYVHEIFSNPQLLLCSHLDLPLLTRLVMSLKNRGLDLPNAYSFDDVENILYSYIKGLG